MIPGLPVKHSIIKRACREGRGEMGAFDEAVQLARAEYVELLQAWGPTEANFHLVLTLEKPSDAGEAETDSAGIGSA